MANPAQTPTSGADILVRCLINHGVDTVFAYPGGASMPLHQSLTKVTDKVRTILPRHEQGGGFMAQGYARTTGSGGCLALLVGHRDGFGSVGRFSLYRRGTGAGQGR